jgi:two-component system response regulator NreC
MAEGQRIPTQPLRLILADDHESIRQGMRALFAAASDIEVVDDVGDVETAIARVHALAPDILLLDLAMPKAGGLAAIRQLTEEASPTAIVVLTRYREEAFVRDALAAGASAYVLKQSPFSEVQLAIMHAIRGERYVDARLAPMFHEPRRPSGRISEREREVLRWAALGYSNKELGETLGIAVKTVEVHKAQGMRKLGLKDRRDFVRYATLQGWLREP